MEQYTCKAYAKINLSLDVIGRLENGYHLVDMVMQTVDIYDVLTFEKTMGEISIQSDCGDIPLDQDNLIYKAIIKMRERFGFVGGVKVSVEKNIPIAAGMAGGSSDAAATLRAINELFELGASVKELQEIGVKIGADVPYCVEGGTMRAEGIGEKLTALKSCPGLCILVAKPDINVATKEVYQRLDDLSGYSHPDVEGMVQAIANQDGKGLAARLGNVLEEVTIPMHPVIQTIKDEMRRMGAVNCLMSGSGPTVFGIFEEEKQAREAKEKIAEKNLSKQIFVTCPCDI